VAIINGIDPDTYTLVTGGLNFIEGSESLASSGKEVLLGKTIADSLDAGIGSNVDLTETQTESFRVVGIYETGTAFQDRGAYIILDEAQNLSERQGQVTAILVKCLDPNEVSAVSAAITKLIPDVRAVVPTAAVQQVSNVLNTVRMFFFSIGLVALSAGTFGAVNTMMTSISERTREIGTLKAIGARDSQILTIFLSEALLLGLIGGVVGLGAGVLLSQVFPILTTRLAGGGIAGILPGGAGNRVGVGIQPAILPSNIILCLSLGVVVGLLAGIYPAMRAARMRPVEALRHV
jgi:putative ABC transport system permease protein